jgi:hypothetical protein
MRALRYLWAAPATLLGLVALVPALPLRARVGVHSGAIEASGGALLARLRWFGIEAITLGHVILARDAGVLARWRAHEQVHVRQYERFGVLLIPLYLASSAWLWLRGRHAYRDNPFERAAFGAEATCGAEAACKAAATDSPASVPRVNASSNTE